MPIKAAFTTISPHSAMLIPFLLMIPMILLSSNIIGQQQPFIIMLNPAGTAQTTGRLIDGHFERSIALHAAESLKQNLEEQYPDCVVIITRKPGQTTTAIQNAHFANSLNVNLFLSLHFYQETDTKPHVYMYRFSYNNTIICHASDFTFYRYDQSYLFNHTTSGRAACIMLQTWLREPHRNQFICHPPVAFPCASLIGVISPAIALDIGIKKHSDWQHYIQPLQDVIKTLKEHYNTNRPHREIL